MIKTVTISTQEELDFCLKRRINPIFYHPVIKLEINFRIYLHKELFGRPAFSNNRVIIANDKFYNYCWDNGFGICENCNKTLKNYSAVFVSHILPRGGYPEYAHDPRNHNILCGECHHRWESPMNFQMRIYQRNRRIIEEIKSDYNTIKAANILY